MSMEKTATQWKFDARSCGTYPTQGQKACCNLQAIRIARAFTVNHHM